MPPNKDIIEIHYLLPVEFSFIVHSLHRHWEPNEKTGTKIFKYNDAIDRILNS